jgi:4-amino-4-deoxy-L-arabinose transferase-like glycosyltransferase
MDVSETIEDENAAGTRAERHLTWPRVRARLTGSRYPGQPAWVIPALLLVTAAAAVAYAWRLTRAGLETYYAAGVRSMAGSWHDFVFGAFDPGGTVTLDKVPGAFWIQALSVRVFGMSVWAMVLPQVIEGILIVLVVFRAVRRIAGPRAGLAGAVIFAATPVTMSSVRGNLADPLFLLLLVLAADATIRALDTDRKRTLILAGVWVGLAFQAKMAEAWLVTPALALTYLVAARPSLSRRILRLLLAGSVMVVVSFSWLLLVTFTSSHDRPYVDGSTHDSAFQLVFEYNATGRMSGRPAYGLGLLAKPSPASLEYPGQNTVTKPTSGSSEPGWDRLVTEPFAGDAGWLLPVALLVIPLGLVMRRREPRTDRLRAGVLLWGVWLVTFAVVFSTGHVVLDYYLAVLVPAIAALGAFGLKMGAEAGRTPLVIGMYAAALWSAGLLFAVYEPWRLGAVLVLGGSAVLFGLVLLLRRRWTRAALLLPAVAILTGPVVAGGWLLARTGGPFDSPFSSMGTFAEMNPAAAAKFAKFPHYGGAYNGSVTPEAWRKYEQAAEEVDRAAPPGTVFAVYSSAQAGNPVLGGARRVLPIGGFSGSVPDPTAGRLTEMIRAGKISGAMVPGPGDVRANDPRIRAIAAACTPRSPKPAKLTAAPQIYVCPR